MSRSRNLHINLPLALSIFILAGGGCINVKERESNLNREANPKIEKLKLPPNFHAEHLYNPSENGQGSWVSMTFDDKGRLITSDQFGSLYRTELPSVGTDSLKSRIKVEKLIIQTENNQGEDSTKSKLKMGYAQGLLWAFNSLYVMVNHSGDEDFAKSSGLYRLQDTDQDDQFDKITLLKSLEGSGEHGPHSIVLSPDKKSLYVVAGNRTDLPEMDAYRLPPVWQQDNMYPLINYPSGGGEVNRVAPAGWIAKVDSSGASWELISAGFRNPYDLAFNEAGDLFTYESDKEFDLGMPWYKPTRIYHVTSGGEFGWRTGSNIWSSANTDKLPAILNIGMGSPTSFFSGKGAQFPEKYQRALYGFDWSFGIIYAIHLETEGASYTATAEEFISGSPLPLTDGLIGPDGSLYFLTGGRKLDSDLYRVYYGGNIREDVELTSNESNEVDQEAHRTRKQLEKFHGEPNAEAIEVAWPFLKHEDRFIRYAARIAVEHQSVTHWQERALTEKDPQILTQAIIALARHGDQSLKNRALNSLMSINFEQLSEQQQLDLLRAFELVLLRMGKPNPNQRMKLINYLNPHYPAETNDLNRSFSKLLVYIEAPQVVEKTLKLLDESNDDSGQKTVAESSDLIYRNPQYGLAIATMQENAPPAQQVYYAIVLSIAKNGWTSESREKYFKWFNTAFDFKGGRNYIGYVNEARKNALEYVPKDRYAYYDSISGKALVNSSGKDLANVVKPKGPGKNWEMADALPLVQNTLVNRDFDQGKAMFVASLCSSCHGMRGEGGAAGPDLTQLGNRFSARDILESIIEPNKVISDQFESNVFYLKDGNSVLGRLINEDENTYYISQNPFVPQALREIPKDDVSKTGISEVSIMPSGLINRLNEEEVKDLIAYLISGGNKDHQVFKANK